MRKSPLAAIAALGLLTTSATAIAQTGGRSLTTELTGAEEVPGPGDPDGTGTAQITINPGKRQVCYTLRVSNIPPATGAHIHEGQQGEAGPVVVTLIPPRNTVSSGCTSVSRELAVDIIRNPSNYYVNVHNMVHPAGAVRGQLGD